jgi:hypothetical protein
VFELETRVVICLLQLSKAQYIPQGWQVGEMSCEENKIHISRDQKVPEFGIRFYGLGAGQRSSAIAEGFPSSFINGMAFLKDSSDTIGCCLVEP